MQILLTSNSQLSLQQYINYCRSSIFTLHIVRQLLAAFKIIRSGPEKHISRNYPRIIERAVNVITGSLRGISFSPDIHYLLQHLAADLRAHVIFGIYKAVLFIKTTGSVVILKHPYKNRRKSEKLQLADAGFKKLRAYPLADILGQQINSYYLAAAAEIIPA